MERLSGSRGSHPRWEWVLWWGRSYWITCLFSRIKETSPGKLGLGWGRRGECHHFTSFLRFPVLTILCSKPENCAKWLHPHQVSRISSPVSRCLSAQWSHALGLPGALRILPSPTCLCEVCRAGGTELCPCMGFTASVSKQSHFPPRNNVLTVESVQIFRFVLNDGEQKVHKNF